MSGALAKTAMVGTSSPGAVRPHEENGLRVAARRLVTPLVCALLPAVLVWVFLAPAFDSRPAAGSDRPAFGFDFRATWDAGAKMLDGENPYPPPRREAIAREDQYVYPPTAAVAALPLRVVSFESAALVLAIALLGATLLSIWLLGVRDWRCFGIVLLWLPVLDGSRLGAISAFVALAAAVAWRYRNSLPVVAVALGTALAIKLFLWPLLIWLAATRRTGAALASLGVGTALVLASWAFAGFAGLREYPALLGALTDELAAKSYSLVAVGDALGLSTYPAQIGAFAIGGLILAAALLVARGRTRDVDRRIFLACLAAAIALSPIVWMHYFVLLAIPIALARPRLSPLWVMPLAFWLLPHAISEGAWTSQSSGELWRILLGVGVAAAAFAVAGLWTGAGPTAWSASAGKSGPRRAASRFGLPALRRV